MTPALQRNRPILFSAQMILALVGGHKIQTRRILNPQPRPFVCEGKPYWNASGVIGGRIAISDAHLLELHRWNVDRLWVREACRAVELESGLDGVRYVADNAF